MVKLGDLERANRFKGCAQAGVYETCELHELGERTRAGWRLVQIVTTGRVEWLRKDGVAVPVVAERHLQNAYGTNARMLTGINEPPVDIGATVLHEQVHTMHVVALVMLDEDSAIARSNRETQTAVMSAQQADTLAYKRANEAKEAREAKAKAEADLAVKSEVERRLLEEREASRERMRRLEGDIGTLRRDKDRLVNAIGAIKAKEILGEAEPK